MSKASEQVKKHNRKYPWRKHLRYAKARSRLKGWCCEITNEEIKEIWDRDKAHLLERPSIDRIDNDKHYTLDNIRFIEVTENARLGNIGRPTTEKQKEAGRINIAKAREVRMKNLKALK